MSIIYQLLSSPGRASGGWKLFPKTGGGDESKNILILALPDGSVGGRNRL